MRGGSCFHVKDGACKGAVVNDSPVGCQDRENLSRPVVRVRIGPFQDLWFSRKRCQGCIIPKKSQILWKKGSEAEFYVST